MPLIKAPAARLLSLVVDSQIKELLTAAQVTWSLAILDVAL